ncbi:MAG: 30S ribosome-binding factor RbfA [Patescibacteria group bacterium]|jgi:ribosome-binding factor A|nr:30S ribosome-binding factor RbfA [Patescibacteria group bacterium]
MTERLEKINILIRQQLSQILAREIELPLESFLTITRVDTSDNFKNADIYISVFPETQAGTTLKILEKNIGHLQRKLNRQIRLKWIPRITFKFETSNPV